MADITLPGSFTDGTAASVATFNDRLYKPGTPATSFAEVNGLLERANFGTGYAAEAEVIQRRQMSRGGTVGRTVDIDMPKRLFASDKSVDGAHIPIPGCGAPFWLPKANTPVVLSWSFVAAHDIDSTSLDCEFKLFIDGTAIAHTLRAAPIAYDPGITAYFTEHGPRTYTGHVLRTGLDKGWHNAYIGVYSQANLLRISVSRFSWLWFL